MHDVPLIESIVSPFLGINTRDLRNMASVIPNMISELSNNMD